jgi:hypothetical protein
VLLFSLAVSLTGTRVAEDVLSANMLERRL